jgi:hypothetical protein
MESLALMASIVVMVTCTISVVSGIILALFTKKNMVFAAVFLALFLIIPWWLLPSGICPFINLLSLTSFVVTRYVV